MLGFCVATCERAQLISRCRHFRVQAAPRALDTIEWPWQEKLFSFSPTPFFSSLSVYIYSICRPLTKFSLRVLCEVLPQKWFWFPFSGNFPRGLEFPPAAGEKQWPAVSFHFGFSVIFSVLAFYK